MNEYDNPAPPDDGGGAPAPVEAPERPTLDKVYADHKIEDDAQKFKQDEFRPLPAVQREDGQEIMQTLNAVTNEVNNLRNERYQTTLKADIDSAVGSVEKETGLDKSVIEVYLDLKAREDGRFRKIWLERHNNPRALNDALQAVSTEIADKFQARSDPNLLANQKAMRAYQSGSSTRQTSDASGWENKSQAEFSKMWNSLIS
jgi:hypothetical protein